MSRLRLALSAALLLMALLAGGCGEDGATGRTPAEASPEPGGTLRIAVQGPVETLDPLLAETRAERLAARQVYEPLVSTQNGPFGQTRRRPGLVRWLKPLGDGALWAARLRPGVSFGDGEPLDFDAVRANAARWMSVDPGPAVIPDLDFVDSPRPGLVRFFLDRPTPDFGRTLAQARLGIVSPDAIAAAGNGRIRPGPTGTGPFEVRERAADRILLARNAGWWGTPLGLGPGVDQLEFLMVDGPLLRAERLRSGSVEVADELDRSVATGVVGNPLLTTLRGGGGIVGVERSVRGLDGAEVDQSLADVWLTDLR